MTRLLNEQKIIKYKLSNADILACFTNFETDVDAYVAEVFKVRLVSDVEKESLKKKILSASAHNYDLTQLTNGHDFHYALGILLRSELSSRAVPQTWGKEVEAHLRLAFDDADFVALSIFHAICKWVRENTPFRVLRANFA